MKKLLLILLLALPFSGLLANSALIGTGSGTITQNGFPGGLGPGDTILIKAPGPYSSININSIAGLPGKNVVILPSDWATGGYILMTGTISVGQKFIELGFVKSTGQSADLITFNGNTNNIIVHDISAKNVAAAIFQGGGNKNFTFGDTTTLRWYKMHFYNINMFKCGSLVAGSFGGIGDAPPKDVCDIIEINSAIIDSTLTNGTEIFGIYFHCKYHDWKYTYNGTITVTGDVGNIQMNGNGDFYNIYSSGGRGYILRLWNFTMSTATPSQANAVTTHIYNNMKSNTVVYGCFDVRNDNTQWTAGQVFGANLEGYYNGGYNLGDQISYWSAVFVIGDWYSPYTCILKYNIGEKLVTNGKPPIVTNQGCCTLTDTTGNYYWTNNSTFLLDTTGQYPTFKPATGSFLTHKGASISYITTDYYGIGRPSQPTPGFSEIFIPAPPCNCGQFRNLKFKSKTNILVH